MTERDWGFALGTLGDPLADIEDWMLPPYPSWLPDWVKCGEVRDKPFNPYEVEYGGIN